MAGVAARCDSFLRRFARDDAEGGTVRVGDDREAPDALEAVRRAERAPAELLDAGHRAVAVLDREVAQPEGRRLVRNLGGHGHRAGNSRVADVEERVGHPAERLVLGLPPEDRLAERLRALDVARLQLVPVDRPGLVDQLRAGVAAGLPDAEHARGGMGEDGHPPGVHHGHRLAPGGRAPAPAPTPPTGSTRRLAPGLVGGAVAASARPGPTYTDHAGGWPSCMIGPTPATCLPRTVNIP